MARSVPVSHPRGLSVDLWRAASPSVRGQVWVVARWSVRVRSVGGRCRRGRGRRGGDARVRAGRSIGGRCGGVRSMTRRWPSFRLWEPSGPVRAGDCGAAAVGEVPGVWAVVAGDVAEAGGCEGVLGEVPDGVGVNAVVIRRCGWCSSGRERRVRLALCVLQASRVTPARVAKWGRSLGEGLALKGPGRDAGSVPAGR